MLDTIKESAIKKISEEISAESEAYNNLADSQKQLELVATTVKNFVAQTLPQINQVQSLEESNELLLGAIVEINNFVVGRPAFVEKSLLTQQAKIQALQKSLNTFVGIVDDHVESARLETEEKNEIIESINPETGKYEERRKIGEKPKKLRNIRNAEQEHRESTVEDENTDGENEDGNIVEEDI